MPAITVRLPSMSSAQVLELSQPGRNSALLVSCRPGWAPGFMITRLYARPSSCDGFQSTPPWPAARQNDAWPGTADGARVPLTRVRATGSAPVPMSTVRTVERGTSAK